MQCYNCGDDAEMEVLMMINGKLKKLNICMDCYKEQMQSMLENMQDENGNIDPEQIQKKMFNFFKENKDEFNKFLGEAMGDENFDIESLNPENFDISQMDFGNSGFNLNSQDVNEIFKKFKSTVSENTDNRRSEFYDTPKYNPFERADNYYKSEDANSKQIRNLEFAVLRKRKELGEQLNKEDYISAASTRDEMREINKKIMIIKRRIKEGNVNEN